MRGDMDLYVTDLQQAMELINGLKSDILGNYFFVILIMGRHKTLDYLLQLLRLHMAKYLNCHILVLHVPLLL